MSRYDSEMSRKGGTRDGTFGGGHGGSLFHREPTPDVPNVPGEMSPSFVPLDIPDRRSPRQAVWRELTGEFDIALFRLDKEWVTAWVMHRSRRYGTGSWRVAWSKTEQRFAQSSELRNMSERAPQLPDLVRKRIAAVLAFRARAFAGVQR